MTTFVTYRDGTTELEQRIKSAVGHFYQNRGKLPTAVIVHKTEVDAAIAALAALGLTMELRGSGGCLVGETWLKTNDKRPALQQAELFEGEV